MCEPFAIFPRRMLRAGLSHREQSVMLCLLSYKNNDGEAWPSRATIATDTGLHISNVHKTVKSLAQKGMIAMNTQSGVRTVYTFPCLDHTTQNLDMVDHAHAPALATATPSDNLPPVTKTEEQAVKTEELPAKHEELEAKTEELEAKTEELAAPDESIAQPAPAISDAAEQIILPVVVHESHDSAPQPALPIICAPQTVAPQQGELLPAPVTAGQGELLPAPAKQKRACRLPDDWRLPRSWGEWAMQEMGMTADAVRWEADKFADYWHAKAGANACKVNWQATWRNWIRKNAEQGGRAPQQQKSKMTQALENLSGTKLDWKHPEKWNPFAKMTDKERADAQAREDAKRNKERK